ncbi:hypothetical protein COLO4_34202 [Corchorus olitorius]|uniref:Uncharacterized protein n=1 Tax=Corchorus olitorius TaxID=93759 RepID=A0A1R3GN43_9ROSI|nr:hypothetical protein COLO4_34202 [Corchorus olitorius]
MKEKVSVPKLGGKTNARSTCIDRVEGAAAVSRAQR